MPRAGGRRAPGPEVASLPTQWRGLQALATPKSIGLVGLISGMYFDTLVVGTCSDATKSAMRQ